MNIRKWKPKTSKEVYTTYGKVLKINLFMVLCVVCFITPFTNWLIPFLTRYKHIEVFRVTLKRG